MVCPVKPRVAVCPGKQRAEDDDQKLGMIGDPVQLAHKSERTTHWQCITMAGLSRTRTILNVGIDQAQPPDGP